MSIKDTWGSEEELLVQILLDRGFYAKTIDWDTRLHADLHHAEERFISVAKSAKDLDGAYYIGYILTGSKFSKWNGTCLKVRIDLAVPGSLDKLVKALTYCMKKDHRYCEYCINCIKRERK